MKKELPIKLYYQVTPIRRTGFSRLKDLDGTWDKIGYLLQDVRAGIRALKNK